MPKTLNADRSSTAFVELEQGYAFQIPYLNMMQQVLANDGLHAYVENEFTAAIYQFPRVRLMVHPAHEWRARELLNAFFGPGFLIRLKDLYD